MNEHSVHTVGASEPAFPCEGPNVPAYGLTKREYFAALALQGLLAQSSDGQWIVKAAAVNAVAYADALIDALSDDLESLQK